MDDHKCVWHSLFYKHVPSPEICLAEGVFSSAGLAELLFALLRDAEPLIPQWASRFSILVTTASKNSRRGSTVDAILKMLSRLCLFYFVYDFGVYFLS